ncbi:MAG: hypothetical protein J6X84_06025 [Treponema sp.]|nr:hypothetical protein [Treponema sp.]
MKIKKLAAIQIVLAICLILTSCFSLKKSPFYDSEWVMQNYDSNMQLYYHHLILSPDHKVMLRVSYADSTNIIVWKGTYKINSKKISFNFTECVRYENGNPIGTYNAKQLIKYYNGDFYYSVAEIGDTPETVKYHLALIRPKNFFYGEGKDVFGNQFEDFVKFN